MDMRCVLLRKSEDLDQSVQAAHLQQYLLYGDFITLANRC